MILTSIHPIESYLYELKQSLHLVKIPMLLSFPRDSNKIIVIAQVYNANISQIMVLQDIFMIVMMMLRN